MDPFEHDDPGPTHSASPPHLHTPSGSGSMRRTPITTATAPYADVEDPFAPDHDDEIGAVTPESHAVDIPDEDDESEAPPSSVVLDAQDSQTHTIRQHPRRIDPTMASEMLADSDAGPSRLRYQPDIPAVRMHGLHSASSEGGSEDEEAIEGDRLIGRSSSGQAKRSPSSQSQEADARAGSSSSGSRASKRARSSLATIMTIGRRIARAASQMEEEDASKHRATAAGNGPIRLETSASDTATPMSHSSRARAWSRLTKRDKALWMWAKVEDLDAFLVELYAYYLGKGIVCIVLTKVLSLLTVAFVIGFSTFLFGCLDVSKIRHDGQLSDIILDHCVSRFSGLSLLALTVLGALYGFQVLKFSFGVRRLQAMHAFYEQLLEIPDEDLQTIPWHHVVQKLSSLLESHRTNYMSASINDDSPQKIDAHDVANRLMRQENYLIALFNRNLIDLKIPVPGLRSNGAFLTRSLEWNLNFCLLGYLFDRNGNVRRQFLTTKHRTDLIAGLKRRFIFMAALNAVFAPFIVMYLLVYSFFRYFEEYHSNPGNLGSRQYTQYARWRFREYNELPHLFRRRCHNSYRYAQKYIEQFPKERTAIVARFVCFIAGSFAAVLVAASVVDPDLFIHFDITPQRNTLFYIGVFGGILATARTMVPDERLVFEPERLLDCVIAHTHYCPDDWEDQFHSARVNAEFGKLYSLEITIFIVEVLSVLINPLILCLSLPKNAPAIVDFFRDFTVHVDNLGYVCSFAVFDFARDGKSGTVIEDSLDSTLPYGHEPAAGDRVYRENKMEQSALYFAATNDWNPDPASSLYLSKLQARSYHHPSSRSLQPSHWQKRRQRQGPEASTLSSKTPAQSVLAQRSQLYDEAFERAGQSKGSRGGSSNTVRGARSGKSHLAKSGRNLVAVEESSVSAVGDGESSTMSGMEDFADPIAIARQRQRERKQNEGPGEGKTLLQHVGTLL